MLQIERRQLTKIRVYCPVNTTIQIKRKVPFVIVGSSCTTVWQDCGLNNFGGTQFIATAINPVMDYSTIAKKDVRLKRTTGTSLDWDGTTNLGSYLDLFIIEFPENLDNY